MAGVGIAGTGAEGGVAGLRVGAASVAGAGVNAGVGFGDNIKSFKSWVKPLAVCTSTAAFVEISKDRFVMGKMPKITSPKIFESKLT